MKSLICRCCGELMPEQGNALSRNPNICASCSSMADGMEETGLPAGSNIEVEVPEAHGRQFAAPPVPQPEVHHAPT
jgi:hypothetical protein